MTRPTVVRPSGTTPRGLPYPGSDATHAGTPGAIQALAEAMEAALASGAGNGIVFDFYAGLVTVSSSGDIDVSVSMFPRLQAINGMVASYGTNYGGQFRWAWLAVVSASQLRLIPAEVNASIPTGSRSVNIVAWGPG